MDTPRRHLPGGPPGGGEDGTMGRRPGDIDRKKTPGDDREEKITVPATTVASAESSRHCRGIDDDGAWVWCRRGWPLCLRHGSHIRPRSCHRDSPWGRILVDRNNARQTSKPVRMGCTPGSL